MAKLIKIKKNEDITSVIEKIWEAGSNELVIETPKGAEFLRNAVAMKLLKREVDRLGKEIVLLTIDEVGREMAKRVGIYARASLPKNLDLDDNEEDVLKEVSPEKYEMMLETQVKKRREQAGKKSKFRSVGDDIRLKIDAKPEKDKPVEVNNGSVFDLSETEDDLAEKIFGRHGAKESPDEIVFASEEEHSLAVNISGEKEKKSWADIKKKGFDRKSFAFRLQEDEEEKESEKRQRKSFRFSSKILAAFIGVAVLVAVLSLYFILPKADVSITGKVDLINQNLSVIADKSVGQIDAKQGKISAQLIKIDKKDTREFAATGSRQLNDKAAGNITIFNEFSSSPQTLVASTRFTTPDNKTFRLIKTVVVPGAKIEDGKISPSSIVADVVADQPGPAYNIGPARFSIPGFQGTPKYDTFYGQSTQAMSGGASGISKIVSQEDIDKGKEQMAQQLFISLDQEVKDQIGSDFKLLDGAIKKDIISVDSSIKAGGPGDKFSLTVKTSASALVFQEKDIRKIIQDLINSEMTENKHLLSEGEIISYQQPQADFGAGILKFKIQASEKAAWNINIEEIKRTIVGKSEEDVRKIFSGHQEIEKAKVVFWPFWVKSVPDNLDKIKVEVKY